MRLFAAIVPPVSALEAVCEVVAAARVPGVEPPPPQGLLRRIAGRRSGRRGQAEPPAAVARELDLPPIDQMYIPITAFGNLTLGDSVKLAKALREDVATWSRPTVALAGGTALEFKGDESVWAKVVGDVDELLTIGRGVPQVVQRLGYFVDRRQFRPWLSVGTITEETTAPYLETVVEALEGFHGESWTVEHVSLMERPADVSAGDSFVVREQMPLAPA